MSVSIQATLVFENTVLEQCMSVGYGLLVCVE